MSSIEKRIAEEVAARPEQVRAAIELIDGGATVPFIARYRKEVTGGLDDTQLRLLEERLSYLRELEDRRAAVIASIDEQGKLTDGLRADILAADNKARLEDLYLPYKPKRRTRAQIAREAGLEPLALALREDPTQAPEDRAAAFVDVAKGVADIKAALDGARAILLESFSEDPALVGALRDWLTAKAVIRAKLVAGKEEEGAKYRDYFQHVEAIGTIPSHRLLALFRARNEGVLDLELAPRPTTPIKTSSSDLMMAAPAGPKTVMGLDPGIRTGVKLAIVDGTGKLLATSVIYPHEPKKLWDQSIAELAVLSRKHGVNLIAIGNGTASRETDRLAAELMRKHARCRRLSSARPVRRCIRPRKSRRRNSPVLMSRCVERYQSRVDCRIHWPSW